MSGDSSVHDWHTRFIKEAEDNARLRAELEETRAKYDSLLEASLQQMASRIDEFSLAAEKFKRMSPSASSLSSLSSLSNAASNNNYNSNSSSPSSLPSSALSTSSNNLNIFNNSNNNNSSSHPLSGSDENHSIKERERDNDPKKATPKKKMLGFLGNKRKDKKEKDNKGAYQVDEDIRTDFVLPLAPSTSYQHLPRLPVCPLVSRNYVVVEGPGGDEKGCSFYTDIVAGRSISTYPHIPGNPNRDGDPIADRFSAHIFENRIIAAVADGCNWGAKPKEAALKANTAFIEFVNASHDSITDVKKAGAVLLNAFEYAHNSIMEGKLAFWDAGTTTLLGGVLLEINKGTDKWTPQWEFVCASVGDCKAFCYSNGEITDITQGNRLNASDPRDCGGRLGPHLDEGKPDLRNLNLFCAPCDDGDMIIIVTDGIHDNLDPQHLGKVPKDMPKEFNLAGDKWDDVDPAKAIYAKNAFITELLLRLMNSNGDSPPTPKEVAERLVNHCVEVTQKSRDYMENNQGKRLPEDYIEFPGKMDHTSCLCFRVGRTLSLPLSPLSSNPTINIPAFATATSNSSSNRNNNNDDSSPSSPKFDNWTKISPSVK